MRDGAKGPLAVEALTRRVRARDGHGRAGPAERLVVVRRPVAGGGTEVDYGLSDAGADVPPDEPARARAGRHRVERLLEEARGGRPGRATTRSAAGSGGTTT